MAPEITEQHMSFLFLENIGITLKQDKLLSSKHKMVTGK